MAGKVLFTLAIAASALLPGFVQAAPLKVSPVKRQTKFPFGTEKVRGVNLGGWFVLEPWITPSIFQEWATSQQVVDEWTFCQTLGQQEAYNRLSQHWNTWITPADMTAIAALGINTVRIPIGYWSVTPLPGDPYVQGAYDVLGQSLDWAQAAGLKVMIDLHGAPGSQNGFDNSGHKGPIGWTQGDTINQTRAALQKITADHASHPAVSTIELVNEPNGNALNDQTIQQFYYDGWGQTTGSAAPELWTTFHDAFLGVPYWDNFAENPHLPQLLLDTHHYEVFDQGQLQLSMPEGHVQSACAFGQQMAQSNKVTISGEWTGAMTDCALWLNGLGVGARYDGTYPGSSAIGSCAGRSVGTVSGLSAQDKQAIRQFTEAQLDAYEMAGGWIWWTWKTESAPEWDMKNQSAAGVFPNPVTSRQYPGQCG